jgi:hypothetical protein
VLLICQLHAEDLAALPLLSASLPSAALRTPYLTSPSLESLDAALADLVTACSGKGVITKEAGENLEALWSQDGFEVVKVVAKREDVEGESRADQLRWEGTSLARPVLAIRYGSSCALRRFSSFSLWLAFQTR